VGLNSGNIVVLGAIHGSGDGVGLHAGNPWHRRPQRHLWWRWHRVVHRLPPHLSSAPFMVLLVAEMVSGYTPAAISSSSSTLLNTSPSSSTLAAAWPSSLAQLWRRWRESTRLHAGSLVAIRGEETTGGLHTTHDCCPRLTYGTKMHAGGPDVRRQHRRC
jgi:hypothetical protein